MRSSLCSWRPGYLALLSMIAAAGCRGTGRLGEYEYPGRTVALAKLGAPQPEILTGPYFFGYPQDPIRAVITAGTRIVKEVEASKARARLDSATAQIDVGDRLSERTLERASLYLRTRPVTDQETADFVLEVRLRKYGIDAKEWNAAAHFFVDAEILLMDGRDGREIWNSGVRSRDPIAPAILGPGSVVREGVTAAAIANLSVAEMVRVLERLADYSADRLTEHLRDALERTRRDRN
jgi:hypothetical protein